MANDFKDKLNKLNSILKEIIGELESCSIELLESHSEQVLEAIYDFADTLAYIEDSRYDNTQDDYSDTNDPAEYDIDYEPYVDEELDFYSEEDEDSDEN